MAATSSSGFERVAAEIEAKPDVALPPASPAAEGTVAGFDSDALVRKFVGKACDPAQVEKVVAFISRHAAVGLKQPCVEFEPWEAGMWGEALAACAQRWAPYLLGLSGYPELEMLAWCVTITTGRLALQWKREPKPEAAAEGKPDSTAAGTTILASAELSAS